MYVNCADSQQQHFTAIDSLQPESSMAKKKLSVERGSWKKLDPEKLLQKVALKIISWSPPVMNWTVIKTILLHKDY